MVYSVCKKLVETTFCIFVLNVIGFGSPEKVYQYQNVGFANNYRNTKYSLISCLFRFFSDML